MTPQEQAKRILPYVQAMAEGKTVEERPNEYWSWGIVPNVGRLMNFQYHYRIVSPPAPEPWGREEWERCVRVRHKANERSFPVGCVDDHEVQINDYEYTFEEASRYFVQLDGSPCVKEEKG